MLFHCPASVTVTELVVCNLSLSMPIDCNAQQFLHWRRQQHGGVPQHVQTAF